MTDTPSQSEASSDRNPTEPAFASPQPNVPAVPPLPAVTFVAASPASDQPAAAQPAAARPAAAPAPKPPVPAAPASSAPVSSAPVPSAPVPSAPVPSAPASSAPVPRVTVPAVETGTAPASAPAPEPPAAPEPSDQPVFKPLIRPDRVPAAPLASNASAFAPAPALASDARQDADGQFGELSFASPAQKPVDDDPLAMRPRISSIVLCAVLGVLMLALAAVLWWLAVRTTDGQQFDDLVLGAFASVMPAWLSAPSVLGLPLSSSPMMMAVAGLAGIGGLAVALVRRRWWLAGQLVAFAVAAYAVARLAKALLPREVLVRTAITESGAPLGNTAPSGHMTLTIVGGLILLMAVPRAARAIAAIAAGAWSLLVAALLVAHGWHRPSDIVVALLLAGGLALVALAFTRRSGMDRPGTRASSMGVQIVASVFLTASLFGTLYVAYAIWQLMPGLEVGAEWAQPAACSVALVAMASATLLTVGATLALRQLTASPLSRLGLVGAPPAPPKSRP